MESWQISDLKGRLVMEGRSSGGQGVLDIRGLQPGMYVLTLENSQSRAQQCFLVE